LRSKVDIQPSFRLAFGLILCQGDHRVVALFALKGVSMLTQAQQVMALCEQFTGWMHTYEGSHKIEDERLYQYRLGLKRMLVVVITRLSPIIAERESTQVETQVVSLLNWLVAQKVCWMSGKLRRGTAHDEQKIWRMEGAIAQIDALIPELCSVLSPRWKSSPAWHGKAFQVYHSRDLVVGYTATDIACQRWCGSQRKQWYQEVAIVRLKRAENQLEGPSENNLKHRAKICETRRHGNTLTRTKIPANARKPQ
jgi:hypothetical protein